MLEKNNVTNAAKNNNINAANQPVIIFHRSAANTREAKITQEMLLLDYNRNYPHQESFNAIVNLNQGAVI